jgi:hypothetical protein
MLQRGYLQQQMLYVSSSLFLVYRKGGLNVMPERDTTK